jgi:hypothetical protein
MSESRAKKLAENVSIANLAKAHKKSPRKPLKTSDFKPMMQKLTKMSGLRTTQKLHHSQQNKIFFSVNNRHVQADMHLLSSKAENSPSCARHSTQQ